MCRRKSRSLRTCSGYRHSRNYFLGAIIISKKDSANYIVDGQQRLTSLTLLLILLRNLQRGARRCGQCADVIFGMVNGLCSWTPPSVRPNLICGRDSRYDEPCSGPGALSPSPSSAVSITNTSGYDFRKGQVMPRLLQRESGTREQPKLTAEFHRREQPSFATQSTPIADIRGYGWDVHQSRPMHCNTIGAKSKSLRSRSPFNPRVDFATQRPEIDRLGQKRLGAVLQRLALGLRVAIGGDHDDGNIRTHGLRLG